MTNVEKITALFDLSTLRSMEIFSCRIIDRSTNGKNFYQVNGSIICLPGNGTVFPFLSHEGEITKVVLEEPIDILNIPKEIMEHYKMEVEVPKDIIVIRMLANNTWSNETMYIGGNIIPLVNLLQNDTVILLPDETFIYEERIPRNSYRVTLKELRNVNGTPIYSLAPQQKQEQKEFYLSVRAGLIDILGEKKADEFLKEYRVGFLATVITQFNNMTTNERVLFYQVYNGQVINKSGHPYFKTIHKLGSKSLGKQKAFEAYKLVGLIPSDCTVLSSSCRHLVNNSVAMILSDIIGMVDKIPNTRYVIEWDIGVPEKKYHASITLADKFKTLYNNVS